MNASVRRNPVSTFLDHLASFYGLPRDGVGHLSFRTLAELHAIKPMPLPTSKGLRS